MEFVENENDILENIQTFYSYRNSSNVEEKNFFKEKIRRGMIFVHLIAGEKNYFCPSRYVGYKNNSMNRHLEFDKKHGTKTTAIIIKFLGKPIVNKTSENKFLEFCLESNIIPQDRDRKYWGLNPKKGFKINDKRINLSRIVNDDIEAYKSEENPVLEGKSKTVLTNVYERNPKLREKAICFHGYTCQACGFNFEEVYGKRGREYIEVHHVNPLYMQPSEHEVDPQKDLVVICSNCHRMVHRRKDNPLSLEDLKKLLGTSHN